MIEKMATPKSKTNEQHNRSKSLLGWKSPKPTVDKEVNAKYVTMTVIYVGV